MKKTIKLLCTWAASLLLTGCSSEADMSKLMDWQSNPDAVHFTASVNNATTRTNPAATDDAQTKFNENDQVTVSNNGNQADYAYNGESWGPAIADKYLLWDRSNLTFNCWYPAGGKNTATVGYLAEDQSTEKLMAKSDYMNAEKTLKTADEALDFSLARKTARIILKISGFTEQFEPTATIKHVRIVSKASTAEGETNTIDITPLTSGGGGIGSTYTALVAPGKVVAKFYFTDNTSTEEPLTMTTIVTVAGSSYIYNLNVIKRTKIEVTGITKGPWTASGTTTGDITPIPYVTFKAEQPQTFKMTATKYYTISGLQYSVNNGDWNDVVADKDVLFGGANGTLRLRGTNTNGTASASSIYSTIKFTDPNVNVACTGDIRTLQDWRNYSTVETQNARFCYLFSGCRELTSAPELPATTLANYCYYSMFMGCTNLNTATKLKATTLADYCYYNMFKGCTNLNTAPELPATTLADCCYYSMFNGCTNLKKVPTLPARKMFRGVYWSMFQGCTSLENAPDLPATELADFCYALMFHGCTKLIKVPDALPARIMVSNCYRQMFYNCTSLTAAPNLPATELAEYCYFGMFWGCKGLTDAPKLKATSLKESCYYAMFRDCTSLTAAPDLPATELVKNCYATMFYSCSKLETGPKELLATTLAERCYDSMFCRCTSLKTVPELPATKLAEYCYLNMFNGCENLSSVKMTAPSDQITGNYFSDWLSGAGTEITTRRTLILKDQAAYNALLKTKDFLDPNWRVGKCTVKAENGSDIK